MSEVIPFIPLSLTCCHANPSLCFTASFLELSTVPALLYFPLTLLWSDLWSHHPQTVYVNTAVTLTLSLLYSIFQSSFYLTSQLDLLDFDPVVFAFLLQFYSLSSPDTISVGHVPTYLEPLSYKFFVDLSSLKAGSWAFFSSHLFYILSLDEVSRPVVFYNSLCLDNLQMYTYSLDLSSTLRTHSLTVNLTTSVDN